jgi:hypothetical protein
LVRAELNRIFYTQKKVNSTTRAQTNFFSESTVVVCRKALFDHEEIGSESFTGACSPVRSSCNPARSLYPAVNS